MSSLITQLPAAFAASLTTIGTAQTLMAMVGVRDFARAAPHAPPHGIAAFPAVTVLKPLHGAEPLLMEALESFFLQDYLSFQLVFGVQRLDDPAASTVRALCARYPHVDAVLVIDSTPHGANGKIANLINMYPKAKHDVLVVSDSDMHVAPDYVSRVAAALGVPGTGLVTSLYVGKPAAARVPAQLGAAYITQIFASGAVMARSLGRQDCLGATMALTRATLRRIGGWEALLPYVADDGVLGKLVLETGQAIVLAATVPATTVAENRLSALFSHELRWARTIRAMAPVGFLLSVVQFPIFWGLLTVLLAFGQGWAVALLGLACAARGLSGRLIERALGAVPTPFWLVPARDVLSMGVMATAFMGQQVAWRGETLSTAQDRVLARQTDIVAASPMLAPREG